MTRPLDEELMDACEGGRTEKARELLDRGANIHASGNWALQAAAGHGRTETVAFLLDQGAIMHSGEPLRYAAEKGHTETVRLLLDRGANIHADNDYAILRAACNGHTETVELLLSRGADIHAKDNYAFRTATQNGHTETVRLLLKNYSKERLQEAWGKIDEATGSREAVKEELRTRSQRQTAKLVREAGEELEP